MTHPHPAVAPSRRGLLLGFGAAMVLGSSRLALAAAPGDARLVVVLLRGALDGLSAVQPYADPDFAGLRGELALPEPGREGGVLDLGGRFGLHPRLATLGALYRANEATVLHAVAGPYRVRSHFMAQDCLESGAAERLDSGWLNRALAALPAGHDAARTGLAVGIEVPLLMRGPARVGAYAPPGGARPDAELMLELARLHAADPVLGPAFAEGLRSRGFAVGVTGAGAPPPNRGSFPALARVAGQLLAAPDGPRVAALEITGWDTHAGQRDRLVGPLGQLDDGIAALREGAGEAWRRTAVLLVTEFGRTVRVNGTRGTDHGTGTVAFLAGGAVAGGRVAGAWPGLAAGNLFEGRDLQPTTDLRSVAKGLLRDHLRLPPAAVAAAFPASEGAPSLGGLVRA